MVVSFNQASGRVPHAAGGFGAPEGGAGAAGGAGGYKPVFSQEWRYLLNLVDAFRHAVFSPDFRAALDQTVFACRAAEAGVLPHHLGGEVEDSLKSYATTLKTEASYIDPMDRRYFSSAFVLLGGLLSWSGGAQAQVIQLGCLTADYFAVIDKDYGCAPRERFSLFEEERNLAHMLLGLGPHLIPTELPTAVRIPLAAAIGRVGLASAGQFWSQSNIELPGLSEASWAVFPDLEPRTLSSHHHALREPSTYFFPLLNWRLGGEVQVDYMVAACMQVIGAMATTEPYTQSRPTRYYYRHYLANYDLLRSHSEGGGGVVLDPELDSPLRRSFKNFLVAGAEDRSWRRLMGRLVDWAEATAEYQPLSRQHPGLTPFLRQSLGPGFMSA